MALQPILLDLIKVPNVFVAMGMMDLRFIVKELSATGKTTLAKRKVPRLIH